MDTLINKNNLKYTLKSNLCNNYKMNLHNIINKLKNNNNNNNNNKSKHLILTTNNNNNLNCIVCNKYSSYKCPKCKQIYCSVDCYKKHCLKCTEMFYKDNVESHLKSKMFNNKLNTNDFNNMIKQNININNNNDNDDNVEYNEELKNKQYERYKQLALKILYEYSSDNNNSSNEREFNPVKELTEEEWKDFVNFINNINDISYNNNDNNNACTLLIENYYPFWEIKDSNDLCPSYYVTSNSNDNNNNNNDKTNIDYNIELNSIIYYTKNNSINTSLDTDISSVFNNNNNNNNKYYYYSPNDYIKIVNYKIINSIPNISKLLKTKKPDIKKNMYNIISIIYTSVYIHIIYCGDVINNIEEVTGLYSLFNSNELFSKETFNNVNEVQCNFKLKLEIIDNYNINNNNNINEFITFVKSNVIKIITNKFYSLDCLIRVYEIIHSYELLLLSNNKDSNVNNNNKYFNHYKTISLGKQKLIFLMSFIKSLNYNDKEYNEVIKEINN